MSEAQPTEQQPIPAAGGAVPEVTGEAVRLSQARVEAVRAEQVDIAQSAVRTVRSGEADIRGSAVLHVEADEAQVTESYVALVRADSVRLEKGESGLVAAQELTVDGGTNWAVVGGVVRLEDTKAVLVIGEHLDGDVRPLLDLKGAALFGILAGVSAAFLLWAREWLRRRR